MKAISTLFLLLIAVFPFAQPTNDTPCTAQPIEINGAPAEGDNTDATTDAGEVVPPPAAGGNSCVSSWCNDDVAVQNSMWYSFVAPAAGAVIITKASVKLFMLSPKKLVDYLPMKAFKLNFMYRLDFMLKM